MSVVCPFGGCLERLTRVLYQSVSFSLMKFRPRLTSLIYPISQYYLISNILKQQQFKHAPLIYWISLRGQLQSSFEICFAKVQLTKLKHPNEVQFGVLVQKQPKVLSEMEILTVSSVTIFHRVFRGKNYVIKLVIMAGGRAAAKNSTSIVRTTTPPAIKLETFFFHRSFVYILEMSMLLINFGLFMKSKYLILIDGGVRGYVLITNLYYFSTYIHMYGLLLINVRNTCCNLRLIILIIKNSFN